MKALSKGSVILAIIGLCFFVFIKVTNKFLQEKNMNKVADLYKNNESFRKMIDKEIPGESVSELYGVENEMKEFKCDKYGFTFSYPKEYEALGVDETDVIFYAESYSGNDTCIIIFNIASNSESKFTNINEISTEAFKDYDHKLSNRDSIFLPVKFWVGTEISALRSLLRMESPTKVEYAVTRVRFIVGDYLYGIHYYEPYRRYLKNPGTAQSIFSKIVFDKEYIDKINTCEAAWRNRKRT